MTHPTKRLVKRSKVEVSLDLPTVLGAATFKDPCEALSVGRWVLFWFGGIVGFGIIAQHTWGTNYGHGSFDTWALWTIGISMIIVCTTLLVGRVTDPKSTIVGPFKSGTLDITNTGDTNESALNSPTDSYQELRNKTKEPALWFHLIYLGLVMILWIVLSDSSDVDDSHAYMRFVRNLERIRTLGYLWVLVVPTAVGGVLDFAQVRAAQKDEPISARSHRIKWFLTSFVLKAVMVVELLMILDPAADYFWESVGTNTIFEIVVVYATAGVIALQVLLFWLCHKQTSKNHEETACAYLDYPAFIALFFAGGFHLTARIRDDHATVAAQAVSGDFWFQMIYAVIGMMCAMDLPADIDHSTDIAPAKDKDKDAHSALNRATQGKFSKVPTDEEECLQKSVFNCEDPADLKSIAL